MKSHVLMFMPRFHDPIRRGTKIQTIRAPRKRKVEPGDQLSLRAWSDKPYRSPQIVLGTAACVDTNRLRIENNFGQLRVILEGLPMLSHEDTEAFAVADGFTNAYDMLQHWYKHRELDRGVWYADVIIWADTFKPEVTP